MPRAAGAESSSSSSIEPVMEASQSISGIWRATDFAEVEKDKEDFEKTHLKITHPSLYLTMMDDDTFDIQCEAKQYCCKFVTVLLCL